MTAIQPALLKEQVSNLISNFRFPKSFIHELHGLLDLYGRHAYHTGKTGNPAVLFPSYRTPEPVLRQIELELTPLLEKNAEPALTLCDALWNESYYEFKLLAARIIGKIPQENSEDALTRIFSWSSQIKEKSLGEALFKRSLVAIVAKDQNSMINRVQNMLNSSRMAEKIFGMQIILASLQNKDFDNLPLVFNMLAPFVRETPIAIRPYIVEILLNLGQRTPKETAYFFQQNLELSIDQDTAWFVRRCLNVFPADTQATLRAAIRKQEK